MNRIAKIAIIREVAIDYHSGMSSRGYRLQCACYRWLKRQDARVPLSLRPGSEERLLYTYLAHRYGDRL